MYRQINARNISILQIFDSLESSFLTACTTLLDIFLAFRQRVMLAGFLHNMVCIALKERNLAMFRGENGERF